jgi:4-hydroxybenzoate polyprenyltransferase
MATSNPLAPTAISKEAPFADYGITRAYLQLVRLPNVFTAMADILLGYFFTHYLDQTQWLVLALLLAASSSLYMAGMVLNDLFDFEVDRLERPHRPLPSGRIHASKARWLGIGLLMTGVVLGWLIDWLTLAWRPGVIVTMLAALVVIYDAALRTTPAAPLVLGGCRALNVLLGMSLSGAPWHPVNFVVAGGVGLYIFGVTWFSRNEAQISHRVQLALSTLMILVGIGVLASYPSFVDRNLPEVSRPTHLEHWQLLMFVLAALIGWRCARGVARPTPENVQAVVKYCIVSLIVLDASVCFTVRGWYGALPILALLIPTWVLGRWIYST